MAYLIADGLILAVLLAFVGASFAARTLSPMVADA